MVSKKNGFSRGYSLSRLDERSRQSPEMLYEKYSPDSSKVYPEQNIGKPLPYKKEGQDYDTLPVDDSDLDAATSDCSSEHDSLCQLSIPKFSSIPNGVASKLKRPSPRQIKTPELRYHSSIPIFYFVNCESVIFILNKSLLRHQFINEWQLPNT